MSSSLLYIHPTLIVDKCIRANTYHLADKEHDECDDFERMSLVVKSRFVE